MLHADRGDAAEIAGEPTPCSRGDCARRRGAGRRDGPAARASCWPPRWPRHSAARRAGVALVAVGGYGRRRAVARTATSTWCCVHEPRCAATGGGAGRRALVPAVGRRRAARPLRARHRAHARHGRAPTCAPAPGMLDARHVAGEADLSLALRRPVLARLAARRPRPAARAARERAPSGPSGPASSRTLLEPDLKESRGGLRDGAVLRALVATWLVDVPHRAGGGAPGGAARRARRAARGDRPARRPAASRSWAGRRGAGWARRRRAAAHVRHLGRRTAYLCAAHLAPGRPGAGRPGAGARVRGRPGGRRCAGSATAWSSSAARSCSRRPRDPADDPWLALRAATAAADGRPVARHRHGGPARRRPPPLPDPWPEHARAAAGAAARRRAGAGPGLGGARPRGLLTSWLPEWDAVRLRPQRDPPCTASPSTGTWSRPASQAAGCCPQVARPDLLLVAALLHDIGKGDRRGRDHSEVGAPVAGSGRAAAGASTPTTRRQSRCWCATTCCCPRRPSAATSTTRRRSAGVAEAVGDSATLDLLRALTEADARAAGARRVDDLAGRAGRRLVAGAAGQPGRGPAGLGGRAAAGRAPVDASGRPDWAER